MRLDASCAAFQQCCGLVADVGARGGDLRTRYRRHVLRVEGVALEGRSHRLATRLAVRELRGLRAIRMEDHRFVLRQYHHLLTRFEAEGASGWIRLHQASWLVTVQQLQLVRPQSCVLALRLVDDAGAAAGDG